MRTVSSYRSILTTFKFIIWKDHQGSWKRNKLWLTMSHRRVETQSEVDIFLKIQFMWQSDGLSYGYLHRDEDKWTHFEVSLILWHIIVSYYSVSKVGMHLITDGISTWQLCFFSVLNNLCYSTWHHRSKSTWYFGWYKVRVIDGR